MGLFGKQTSDTHDERKRLKELKGVKGKDARKERRQIRKMTKAERELVLKTAAKDKVKEVISKSGRIIGVNAIKQIPVYRDRLKNGKCPFCGEPPEKRGHVCDSCKGEIRSMPSAHEINNTNKSRNLGRGIPDGQNINGRMECVNGHRAFFYEAHGKWDCSQGCNS